MRICVVGDPGDLTALYIAWLARRRGVEVIELDEAALGVDWAYAFDDLRPRDGALEFRRTCYRFSELGGAFVRFHPRPTLPSGLDLGPDEQGAFVAERRDALHHLLNTAPFAVANRPSAGRSNGSKPFQMRLLAAAGFAVPTWVVSNDRMVVEDFAQRFPAGTDYKACSGLRSMVKLLDEEVLGRLGHGSTPIIVQEYVQGHDVRVHTVGLQAFGTAVRSAGIDYRFEHEGNEFRAAPVPPDIHARCAATAQREGLLIAGFDFRVTADGRWYCLEVNPVPTFLPYEVSTGQPIGDALLDALTQQRKS